MENERILRSDAELILTSREDPDCFRVLYDRYCERVYAFFWRRTQNREAALDLTAETFAQAWKARERFRDLAAGSAGPWLFTIAKRLLLPSVRRRRLELVAVAGVRLESLAHGAVACEPSPGWLEDLDADLERALDDLPRQESEALLLRVLGDFSYATIAARLGCTSTAARIRVSRGLKRLRTALEAEG